MADQRPATFPDEQYPALPYARPTDARNGVAIAALVVGVLSFLPCPIIALCAIVLGIVALVRARHLPVRYRRQSMAAVGLCCGVVGFAVSSVPFDALTLTRYPEISRRARCATNLRGIRQALMTYAYDNLKWYPIAPHRAFPDDGAPDVTSVAFVGQLSNNFTVPLVAGETDAATHPSRSMFMLVIDGSCTTTQFICPASGDVEDDLRNMGPNGPVNCNGYNRFDFKGYPHLSYGYQLPFGRMARPSENLDPGVAILADKGPYFDAGAPIPAEGRTPYRPTDTPGSLLAIPGISDATSALKLSFDNWVPFNSRNHKGEGQNVAYQDGHVDFVRTPLAGMNHDNIYTQQASLNSVLDTLLGRRPADFRGPLTRTDSVIVP